MSHQHCVNDSICETVQNFLCDVVVGYCVPCSRLCADEPDRCAEKCTLVPVTNHTYSSSTLSPLVASTTEIVATEANKPKTTSSPNLLVILLSVAAILLIFIIIIVIMSLYGKRICDGGKRSNNMRTSSNTMMSVSVQCDAFQSDSLLESMTQIEYPETSHSLRTGVKVMGKEDRSYSNLSYCEETVQDISHGLIGGNTCPGGDTSLNQHSMRLSSPPITEITPPIAPVQESYVDSNQPSVLSVSHAEQRLVSSSSGDQGTSVVHITAREEPNPPSVHPNPQTAIKERLPSRTLDRIDPVGSHHHSNSQTASPPLSRNNEERCVSLRDSRHANSSRHATIGPESGVGLRNDLRSGVRSDSNTVKDYVSNTVMGEGGGEKRAVIARVEEEEEKEPLQRPVQVAESLEAEDDEYRENGLHVIELPITDTGEASEETLLKEPIGLSFPREEVTPSTEGGDPHIHPNRRIYGILRRIQWVLGYYSEGREIDVYVDYSEISPEMALQELVRITNERPEKFKVSQKAGRA